MIQARRATFLGLVSGSPPPVIVWVWEPPLPVTLFPPPLPQIPLGPSPALLWWKKDPPPLRVVWLWFPGLFVVKEVFGSFVLSPCETPKARPLSIPLPSSHPRINSPLRYGNWKVLSPSPAPNVVPINYHLLCIILTLIIDNRNKNKYKILYIKNFKLKV